MLGNPGDSFQELPRKLAKAYFIHMDAAKEKTRIAKASRKRWRKGRQNRTQIIGVLATAHLDFVCLAVRGEAFGWCQIIIHFEVGRLL